MKNIFFGDEVLSAEKKICTGMDIPSLLLMENAGANSANYILNNFPDQMNSEIVILTGKGNNAGDGFVLARHLANKSIQIKILMTYPEEELKGDSLINFKIIKNSNSKSVKIVDCKFEKILKKEIDTGNKIVIDAIFGVGFKGELEHRLLQIIEYINTLRTKVIISLDIPSGLLRYNQTSVCIKAGTTLAMGVKKFCTIFEKGKIFSGNEEVMDIGISENEFNKFNESKIFETECSDISKILPRREINSHKYSNGKVLIIAGSKGLTGAAALCSLAALRTGSGAVITAIPESLNHVLEAKLTEIITMPLSETDQSTLSIQSYEKIKERLKWADTVLIGPGLSRNEETLELVRKIVGENDLNFVIDADGIFAFRGNLNLLKDRNYKIILTPHFGEFSNLMGISVDNLESNFYNLSRNFAREYEITLVLKNAPSIITNGDNFFINPNGRENLATVGTGDVLSGIISSLYSQTNNSLGSALAGCYIHGMSAENLFDVYGPSSMIASDLINEIPSVKTFLLNCEN